MAENALVALLRRDPTAWNSLRLRAPEARVDLRGADLSGIVLKEVNLNFADLQGASLREADLDSALFLRANLSGAALQKASLAGAHLVEADLQEADLSGARLPQATLIKSNLLGTRLDGCDLSGAMVTECCLVGAHLAGAHLIGANLGESDLCEARLAGADLSGIKAQRADFRFADLTGASLRNADLFEAGFMAATLHDTDLSGAHLAGASLVRAKVGGARFSGCAVYGLSAWDLRGEPADQSDLVITPDDEVDLAVDNLEVAQFLYLLLHNYKIRNLIDTVTTKVVLILGRFTEARKAVLEAIRDRLKSHGYVPVIFDFARPANRNLTETVQTLAHMARFVVADITEAKSIPQELMAIVPSLPSLPVALLVEAADTGYAMADDLADYDRVFEAVRYRDIEDLLAALPARVIEPAEAWLRDKIERRRRRQRGS